MSETDEQLLDENIENSESQQNEQIDNSDEVPLVLNSSNSSSANSSNRGTLSYWFEILKNKSWFRLLQIVFATTVPILLVFSIGSIDSLAVTEYQYKYFANELDFNISFKNTSYCYVNKTDPNFQKQIQVQQKSTTFKLAGLFCGLTSLFGVGFICKFADKKSRCMALRLVLAVYSLVLAGNGIIMFYGLNPYFLLIGTAVFGCLGGAFSVITISSILFGDVLEQQWQILANISADLNLNLGVIIGMFFASGITDNFYLPYIWCFPCVIIGVIFTFFMEKLIPRNIYTDRRFSMANSMSTSRTSESSTHSNSDQEIIETSPIEVVKKHRPHNKHIYLRLLIFAYALLAVTWGRGNIDDLYALNQPFCMGAKDLGIVASISSAFSFSSFLFLGVLESLQLTKRPQIWFYIGAIINGVRYITYVFAETKADFYAQSILGSIFTGNLTPIIRAELTKTVDKHEQGSVVSALFTVMYTSYILGAILHLEIYQFSVSWFPKLALISIDLPAGLILLSTVVWIHVTKV